MSMIQTPFDIYWQALAAPDETVPLPLIKARLKEAALPIERLFELFVADYENGFLTWKYRPGLKGNWNVRYAGTVAGTTRDGAIHLSIKINGRATFFLVHRVLWAMCHGRWPLNFIDHEDCDPSNNRISNLREADYSGNGCNRHVIKGAVPYKGVYYLKRYCKFAAQIKINKQWSWLGVHDTAEDAARAYDVAAVRLHGDFARTNSSLGLL